MARLLPSLPDSTNEDREPRIVGVDEDEADALLAALGSGTARDVLLALHETPATTSELADELETSLQNVQYHLRKLSDADLIDVVDTAYSEKGREMDVYAPADEPLVLFAGGADATSGLKSALMRLLGGYGILGLTALFAQQLFSAFVSDVAYLGADDVAVDRDSAAESPEEPLVAEDAAPEDADVEEVDGIGAAFDEIVARIGSFLEHVIVTLEPGVLLFLAAAVLFTVWWGYHYRGELRR